jgi:hypothetical protein
MLKIIGILGLLSLSTNAFSHEYVVAIFDELTGEVVVEKCADEVELNAVVDYAQSLKDESVKLSIKKIFSLETLAIKRGGEGSGD